MRTLADILRKYAAKAASVAVLAVVIVISVPARANNIRLLGKPVVENKDTARQTVDIRFDVAWENSWKAARPGNWDAAWIFVKVWDGGAWNHAYLCDADTTYVAGSTDTLKSVSGAKYKVADKSGNTDAPMTLEPAYSWGYPAWYAFWDDVDVDGGSYVVKDYPDPEYQQLCVGFFLHRKVNGAGDIVVPGVQLTWQYGRQMFTDEDEFTVRVFVVEMVYVPKGGFYIGGKGTKEYQYGSFTFNGDNFGYPYHILSEKGIPIVNDSRDSTLWAIDGAIDPGSASWPRIPDAFPKGHSAFYIMKYELSQQGWCDFLNCISAEQRATRMDANMNNLVVGSHTLGEVASVNELTQKHGLRHYVKVKTVESEYTFGCDAFGGAGKLDSLDEMDWTDWVHADDSSVEWMARNIDGQDVAMYMVSPRDLFAYAEFACLRPMTEFEYEKACRGSLQVQIDEYAWGDNITDFFGKAYMSGSVAGGGSLTGYIYDFANGDERVGKDFNCGYTRLIFGNRNIPAPLRVGCMADSTTTRHQAGASYWGVMNLSDNVAEICISAYSEIGRRFTGVHGAGQVDLRSGEAVQAGWAIPTLAQEAAADGWKYNQFIVERGMCFQYTEASAADKDEFWSGSAGTGNDNEVWAKHAGMVSARYRVQAGTSANAVQKLGTRNIVIGNGEANVYAPVMRGIRCVRTANAQK